jgi:hypothetical protein
MFKFCALLTLAILILCGSTSLTNLSSIQAQSSISDLPMTTVNETESKITNSSQSPLENTTTTMPTLPT